ncbi:hypothetical protein OAW28_05960 [Alphaproteobacteria bacterium]|nr:hypothetical protein [Alphaproteobacteria bacterium]
MKTHHTSLYYLIDNPKPFNLFKQKLATWQKTCVALRIRRVERSFDAFRFP